MVSRFSVVGVMAFVWLMPAPGFAGETAPMPACALSGSTSVMMNGKPALRLSDVVNCPPELYEIVQSVMIEGQPMVQFRSGTGEKGDCTSKPSNDITVEGAATQSLGDVACTTK